MSSDDDARYQLEDLVKLREWSSIFLQKEILSAETNCNFKGDRPQKNAQNGCLGQM